MRVEPMDCGCEQWLPVQEFGDRYWVSSHGRVKSVIRGLERILSQTLGAGYLRVCFTVNGKSAMRFVHRLVLEAFVGPAPEGMECCHSNGIRTDNRLENLRWDTRRANAEDKRRHGTWPTGVMNGRAKLDEAKVIEILSLLGSGELPQRVIAERMGVDQTTVSDIKVGRSWAHLSLPGHN